VEAGTVPTIRLRHPRGTSDHQAQKHPAPFPEMLAHDHIVSWSNPGDLVLDPFFGSGTTGKMAFLLSRRFVGIEVSKEYAKIAYRRIHNLRRSKNIQNLYSAPGMRSQERVQKFEHLI
jgi:DNA modification methylase